MKSLNVLMTAGSRRVPLVQAFRHALRALGVEGRVIVTDVNPLSPAVHVADRAYRVPMATDPAYLTELLDICEAERVRLVVPTIDDELPMFGEAREQFRHIGTMVACSPASTSLACNDKFATCAKLSEAGVPAAKTYLPGDVPGRCRVPALHQAARGSWGGGRLSGAHAGELQFFLGYVAEPVVQEYLDGPEFTIDVLCDFDGTPLSIVPRERVVIRAGVIDRGRTVNDARAHRARQGRVRRAAVCRADQHPVPDAGQRAGDLRNQSAVLRRHPAHDPGRRRLRADAADAGAGPQGGAVDR